MDSRIIKALRMLGFSEERIAKFVALVDGANTRARVENMVTRDVPKKPKAIRVTYKGKGATDYKSKAERTLSRMTKKRAVPPPVIVALEDAPATVPGPREDSPQWLKDAATAQRRFSRAGVYNRLASTLAALERSRIHKR